MKYITQAGMHKIIAAAMLELTMFHAYAVGSFVPSSISGSGDAKQFIEEKGESVINILGMFGIFACIAGAIYGGIKIGTGDPDKGKAILVSSLIGASVIVGVNSLIGVVLK